MDNNTAALLAIAVFNLVTAIFAWRSKVAADETKAIAIKTELNTNSMREQLVARTGEAEHARGRDEMRVQKEESAAREVSQAIEVKLGIAEGIAQEHARGAPQPVPGPLPLPVADHRTASASERSAAATERVADAAEGPKGPKKT